MTVTIVIANYRYEHVASQAIESALSQTRKPDRVLFVDDASYWSPEKDTLDRAFALASVVGMYDIDVLARKKNLGIVDNFDDILKNHVQTDRVLYLGADNWLRPDALEKMLAADVDICGSWAYLFGTEVSEFKEEVPCHLEDGYWVWEPRVPHGSSLYNVKLAKEVGYKRNPKSIKTEEDRMLFDGMSDKGASNTILQEPLLYYRRHKNNFQ